MSERDVRNRLVSMLKAALDATEADLWAALEACGYLGTVQTHAFANERGFLFGYFSCLPHANPTEESIDGTITIELEANQATVLTDVLLSSGEMLEERPIEAMELGSILGATPELEDAIQRAVRWLATSIPGHICAGTDLTSQKPTR